MDMLAALRLQIEWGADEALEDAPIDRTRARDIAPAAKAEAKPAAAPGARSASLPRGPAARARAAAAAAADPEALRTILAGYTDCPLAATATNLVFADGNPAAGLVLVGEAPGAEEDLAGRPFVGPAGRFLDRMLASIGLSRTDLLMTCLIPWRPPGNRQPTDAEIQTCTPFLLRHLALLRPRVVVPLGTLPLRALTGRDETIRRLRGRWQTIVLDSQAGAHTEVVALPMLNPAFVLENPASRKDAWTDLLALRRHLDAN
jgi:DNA polymerase